MVVIEGPAQQAEVDSAPRSGRYVRWLASLILALAVGFGLWFALWFLRPDLLAGRMYYDLVANRAVTEQLVDSALLKLERWDILGDEQQVLYVHPSASGSATLVYPTKIEPATTFLASLAIAPEAWSLAGDGVTFSLYVEDEAGIHLVSSAYVDPKHHQQDRRWVPMRANLARFAGKLVRLILVTSSGPAGDQRYDWAGWGQPRLVRPIWP